MILCRKCSQDITDEVNDAIRPYDLALQSLTCGGSEFVHDPKRCVEYAKARINRLEIWFKRAVEERDENRRLMRELLREGREVVKVLNEAEPGEDYKPANAWLSKLSMIPDINVPGIDFPAMDDTKDV